MRQSSVFTHQCQKHTPSSPTCQGLLVLRHFVVSYSLQPHGLPTARECSVFLRFKPKKKDILRFIPLHPDSQYLFAVEWRGPDTLEATQYTRTVLQVWGGQPPSFWKCISKGNEGPEPGEGSSAYNMLIIIDK